MLEQLLKSGLSMMDTNKSNAAKNSFPTGPASNPSWSKFGAGCAAGDVLNLLLGIDANDACGRSAFALAGARGLIFYSD